MNDNEAIGCVLLFGFFLASVAFSVSVGTSCGLGWGIATFFAVHGLLALSIGASAIRNRQR